MHAYGNYVLIKIEDEDNPKSGEVINIGNLVSQLKAGDFVHFSDIGPYFEFHYKQIIIEPDDNDPERPLLALIDWRDIILIDNERCIKSFN